MNVAWGAIFITGAVVTVLCLFFLWTRFCRFGIVQKIAGDRKWMRRLLGLVPMLIIGVFMVVSLVNTAIVMIHMSIVWLLAELVAWIVRKIRSRKSVKTDEKADVKPNEKAIKSGEKAAGKTAGKMDKKPVETTSGRRFRPYIVGIVVFAIEICYFSVGWYLNHHVWETDYQLVTEKDLGMEKLRIAQIADSHVGVTFDGEGFEKHLEAIQAQNPDILVITGDFVDDDTTKEDMLRSCLALARFQCKYGVYYIFGNHDKGYFAHKNFSGELLKEALDAAGVHVLEDGVELVDDKFYIVGRKDKRDSDRADIDKIVSMLDPTKYIIILDHQPNDYAAEAATGADLVLSGHTHGGQMLEINLVGALIGSNDRTYGMETRDRTTFIVTSGISDWAIKFKTGCRSEYVIIDVTQK